MPSTRKSCSHVPAAAFLYILRHRLGRSSQAGPIALEAGDVIRVVPADAAARRGLPELLVGEILRRDLVHRGHGNPPPEGEHTGRRPPLGFDLLAMLFGARANPLHAITHA